MPRIWRHSRCRRVSQVSVLLLVTLLWASASRAVFPLGQELQVNTATQRIQGFPSVAGNADDGFVVVWESYDYDPVSPTIEAQRYASTGNPLGSEFRVGLDGGFGASVSGAGTLGFVVTWSGAARRVQSRRFAADGSPLGAQFEVDASAYSQIVGSVGSASNGDFVVVWSSYGSSGTDISSYSVQGRRFASDGNPRGATFQVNTHTTGGQGAGPVAVSPAGDFVVVWTSEGSSGSDASGVSVQAQRYSSNGGALGAEFQVNTYTTDSQRFSSVVAMADGSFVVAWESLGSAGDDSSSYSIQAQRYASDGAAQGGEFQVNTYTTGAQQNPSVAAAEDGRFVVAWNSDGGNGTDTSDLSIRAHRFASDGSRIGQEFQINTYTTDRQWVPSVASTAEGQVFVVWESDGSQGTDDWDTSIQGQRQWLQYPAVGVPAVAPLGTFGAALLLGLLGALGAASRRRR